jgi:8-oxo-dGTP diphosphatase
MNGQRDYYDTNDASEEMEGGRWEAPEPDQLVVGAVICNDGNVLLLKRPADDFMGGIWELPGGKVEPGETIDAALSREVKEETGLDMTTISGYIDYFDYASGSGKTCRQYNFVVNVKAVEPIILTEHDEYLWTDLEGPLPVTDAVRDVLSTYARRVPRRSK